jgi:hypothetical protein
MQHIMENTTKLQEVDLKADPVIGLNLGELK